MASGDVNGDGIDDLVTGAGEGGGPQVLVFTNASPVPILGFFAYAANFTGGVRVGTVDFDGDKFDDIVTGAGPGGGPHVRIISGRVLANFNTPADLASFFAYDAGFTSGVYVAGSDVKLSGGSPLLLDDSAFPPETPASDISADELAGITAAAISRFAEAGLDSADLAKLKNASVQLADLKGNLLGLTVGERIFIDASAAGFGYFLDPTPGDDAEFLAGTGQAVVGPALNHVDLLTVVTHELAHVLGLPDLNAALNPDDLLADRLARGFAASCGRKISPAWTRPSRRIILKPC